MKLLRMAALASLAAAAFSTAGAVVAAAAGPQGTAAAVVHATGGQGQSNTNQGQNGQGQNNDNQGQNGQGQGTRTPELPSGVLFAIGLLPLLAGVLWLRRRGRTSRT